MDNWWLPLLEPDGLLLRDRALREVDPDHLLVALRSGRLRRVQRGVYLPRSIEYRPLTAARAAIISSGVSNAVASHATAARIHGIVVPGGRRCEHVTVPHRLRRDDRKDLRFHVRRLALGDTVLVEGIPMTSLPRTLADLGFLLDRLSAVWAFDDALRRRLTTREEIRRVLDGWRGGKGSAVAGTRLAEADGKAESVLETAGRLTLADADLPLPVAQHTVRSPDGRVVARLDGAYLDEKVGIEYDGRTPHEAPTALYRDRQRQNALVALGWSILRFTWWDVTQDSRRFTAAVARELGRHGLRRLPTC